VSEIAGFIQLLVNYYSLSDRMVLVSSGAYHEVKQTKNQSSFNLVFAM
jgi:hypothetical protein